MPNTEPAYFDDLAYYPQLVLKKRRYRRGDIMFYTGKSKNKTNAKEYYEWFTLDKNPFNTIFLFTHGKCNIRVGLNDHALKPHDLVIIPQRVAYCTSCLIENKGYCIHFKTEYVLPFLKIGSIEDILPFVPDDSKYIISLTDEQADALKILFEEIYREYDRLSKERDNIMRCYIEILLLRCKEYFQRGLSVIQPTASHGHVITRQFKALVEKNFLAQRRVEGYAEMLHISQKHLEKTVKEILGVSPKQLIHDILLTEAKVLLKQTEKTISEIAHELKFEDQSYFSRFFKKHTRITPQRYRSMV